MKSVLISIQPKWCELIASGKKTVEVRKTRPKIDTPFKVYIYCTSSNVHECLMINRSGATLIHSINYKKAIPCGGHIGNGKVIGEFVCDHIMRHCEMANADIAEQQSRVKREKILEYANGNEVYGWHISDLVIYDKPKELSEFRSYNCSVYLENGYPLPTHEIKRPPQSWYYVTEQ